MSITTTNISGITDTTATTEGNVTASGGVPITARSVCWSNNRRKHNIELVESILNEFTPSFEKKIIATMEISIRI